MGRVYILDACDLQLHIWQVHTLCLDCLAGGAQGIPAQSAWLDWSIRLHNEDLQLLLCAGVSPPAV